MLLSRKTRDGPNHARVWGGTDVIERYARLLGGAGGDIPRSGAESQPAMGFGLVCAKGI